MATDQTETTLPITLSADELEKTIDKHSTLWTDEELKAAISFHRAERLRHKEAEANGATKPRGLATAKKIEAQGKATALLKDLGIDL